MPQTHTPYLGHPQAACQNPLAKARSYSNLPQSKRALQEPLRIEPLATAPPQGGGGSLPSTFVPNRPNPARLSDIGIEVTYPFDLSAKDREGVLHAVHKCLIHNTLVNPPKIRVELRLAEVQAAA